MVVVAAVAVAVMAASRRDRVLALGDFPGKQEATATCKTCCVEPLVDGIGSVPKRMMSTAGLELTNFINPDLTWKKVAKGNRSATRRTRKPGGRNLIMGAEVTENNVCKRAEDTTVSESEKLGVAVLGRRFSDEIEHVPIKKRKFNFRSSSPSPPRPQTPSSIEVVEHASGQGACSNSNGKSLLMVAPSHGVVDEKISGSLKEKLGYREDFSGIEILAAAACGNSFDADVDHPEEKPAVEGSVQDNGSTVLMGEAVAVMEASDCPSRDADGIEDSSVQDTSATFVQNSSNEKENRTLEKSVPSRLHWDLNVVMDAWEEPCDGVSVGSQTKDVEGTSVVGSVEHHILKYFETESETKILKNDKISTEVHEETHLFSDGGGLAKGSDREDNQMEASSGLDRGLNECDADLKDSTQVVSLNSHIASVVCQNNVASDSSLPCYVEKKTECCASSVQEEKVVPAESAQVDEYDVASTHVSALDRVVCESDRTSLNENGEDSGRASSLHNDVNTDKEMISMDNCEQADPVMVEPASKAVDPVMAEPASKAADPVMAEPASKAEEACVDHPSPKYEYVASSGSVKEVETVVAEEAKGETALLHVGSEEPMHMSSGIVTARLDTGCGLANEESGGCAPSNSSCKINFEESCDDICVSDTSHDGKVHTVLMESSRELQDGYDSQFEDGELRETDAHCWEENDCEGEEIEQVDYESECDGERLCTFEAEDTDNKRKFESGSSLGSGEVTEKSEQGAVGDAFGDSLMSSEARISEAAHGNKIKKDTADCEESSGKDFTYTMVGARASRRDLLSRTQGSLSSNVLQRCGSNNFDDLCPRSERESDPNNRFMGRDRFSLHMRRRSPGGGHIVNTRQSPPCHGPYGSGRPRPRSVVESRGFLMASDRTMFEVSGVEGFDSRVRRQYMSSSSNSVYRSINRRPLGCRDDIYTGTAPIRDDIGPDRSRFRRYPEGISRGFREDYRRPMPNYPADDHMPHRIARRERSISPLGGERPHYAQPYKKPRSRSRSRSPSSWFSMRDRNEGSRRRSRSPDFRSTRINRVRAPFKKRFEVEYEEGFMSPPRNRMSPQRNPPRFDDRISGLDNFRDRKSPVRMFRQSQRFDSSRPFRPMIPPRRFPDMGSGAGRGYKYEGTDLDDRRKPGNRYEVIHRVRRYDNDGDGVMRRLRYNNNPEDSFVANES
ncbi:Dentin sialophosphoprotein-like protein [Citrus sinensis]|uniref:Dentin sialophosphoprotein-like protein n=1 Tax=Citrus sinensis TaxID=2711 RepID=A0ACB8HS87_CITSI|nr:Dentin sialophosphoprotein-like protein [Citrus sinensis]